MDVSVIQTGTANLASVLVALERLGVRASVTRDAGDVERASMVVLPGVGTLAAAREALDAAELVPALIGRVAARRPLLGICLGHQLLAAASEESPGVPGFGAVDVVARRFDEAVVVPQMGWNRVAANGGLLSEGWAYFANSFALMDAPPEWAPAWATYGEQRFVAAVQNGGVLGCQFHPELSGEWGLALIERWVKEASC